MNELPTETLTEQVALARTEIAKDGYAARVYAALLGKVIGVYVGRPFEGWDYAKITERFGQIDRYVAEDLGKLVVVTDDDIAGTLTFIRAARDSGRGYDTTSDDIADAWLNYLIEGRSVLWWGGMSNSTEHTAYLRLKAGYRPPESGSAKLNGTVVSEQIGAQIFIDGWGLIAPGAPKLAAELARRAAVVSHDGEAVFGAQMIAAMEAAAFTTSDIDEIIEAGLATIPSYSLISTLVSDLRGWHAAEPDWRRTRERLEEGYGYHRYGGGCHMIPNHGLIILTLLYCGGDFSTAMTIVNTSGWDTDCNSGNVGCLLGLIGGLASIDAGYDWRGPVADRLYVPTTDSGSAISDVVQEAHRIVEIAWSASGLDHAQSHGARFDFAFPGSVQGFRLSGDGALANAAIPDVAHPKERALRVLAVGEVELSTPTFVPLEARNFSSYPLDAAPTIYSGQQLAIRYVIDDERLAGAGDVLIRPLLRYYNSNDEVITEHGPTEVGRPGRGQLQWTIPPMDGKPICEIGLSVCNPNGRFYLSTVDWSGTPTVDLVRASGNGEMWRRIWVSETDFDHPDAEEGLRLISNGERRLAITGTREWSDYRVEVTLTPHWAEAIGLAARVQGRDRYYLLRLTSAGTAQFVRRQRGTDEVIVEREFPWTPGQAVNLRIDANQNIITAYIGETQLGVIHDQTGTLQSGGVAIVCEGGRVGASSIRVLPLAKT